MRLIDYKSTSVATRCMQTLVISTVLASIAANSATAKNNDIPLHFSKGAISSVITGKLNPNDNERWYRFDATNGQYAVINITPFAGTSETANVGVLHMPNGTQDGSKGGIVYQSCLPATGTYRLRIARNLMATEGKIAGYKVEVMVLPTYASQPLCK